MTLLFLFGCYWTSLTLRFILRKGAGDIIALSAAVETRTFDGLAKLVEYGFVKPGQREGCPSLGRKDEYRF